MARKKTLAKNADGTRYRYVGEPGQHYPQYGMQPMRGEIVVDFAEAQKVGLAVPPDDQRWKATDEPATLTLTFELAAAKPVRTVSDYSDRPDPQQMPLQWHVAPDKRVASFSVGDEWLEFEAKGRR